MQSAYINNSFRLDSFGWKSYNKIKKKAMEREFSWSGLLISLSVAFFIVIGAAQGLKIVYTSISAADHKMKVENTIYRLEHPVKTASIYVC